MRLAKTLIVLSSVAIVTVIILVKVVEAGHGVPGIPVLGSTASLNQELIAFARVLDAFHVYLWVGLAFVIAAYFVPTTVALIRQKQNTLAIFLLNLFLGWSFVGWVVAIVWAASVDRD